MPDVSGHFVRTMLAGAAALLPIAGTIAVVIAVEKTISSIWLARQWFYVPGVGLLLLVAAIYLCGLLVATFLGRWTLIVADGFLRRIPAVRILYKTAKGVLGVGQGDEAMFKEVVLVRSSFEGAKEIGFVTNSSKDGEGEKVTVFVPSAPNPLYGRVMLMRREAIEPSSLSVQDALQTLLTIGCNPIRRLEIPGEIRPSSRF
jgi:uncharacterized membrane protein